MKKCRTGCPRDPQKAFTLIELLSVIAVIAILAALLFPVLGSSQERAKLTQCLSNVRQWGNATTLYMIDSLGVFPERGAGADGTVSSTEIQTKNRAWYNVLPPYVGTPPMSNLWNTAQMPRPMRKSLFICPGAKPELTIGGTDNRTFYSSYAQNYWIDTPAGTRGCNGGGASGFGQLLRLSQVKNPAVFPVVAENSSGVAESQPEYKFAYTHAYYMGKPVAGDAFRHSGQANIAFADGHAASFKKEAIYSTAVGNVYANYGGIQWNPDRNADGSCP